MIPYTENPKDGTGEVVKLITEFGKVARYKIHTQKSVAFLTTKDNKEKLNNPFTIASKRTKYLGINQPT